MIKTDTQLLNEVAINSSAIHPLTEEESALLKKVLLSMLKDIASLCEENQLTYMLGGGSCLGAIRHKGFIPWDDDIDLMMPRKDYECLIRICINGGLGANYSWEAPNQGKDCLTPYLKVFRCNTLDIELINENTPFQKGVFIDIFPIDYAPQAKMGQIIKGIFSDFLQFISTCVLYAQYPSEKFRLFLKDSPKAFSRYNKRLLIGGLFRFIPHEKWISWFDRLNASGKESDYLTVPCGRKRYRGELQCKEVFLPTQDTVFEDLKSYVPGDVKMYLQTLYGDYMTIPPIQKRERHLVYKFCIKE